MPTQEEIDAYLKESKKQYIEDKKLKKEQETENSRIEKSLIREIKTHKKGRKIPLVTYSEMYETLDREIEEIEELIATCIPLEDIAEKFNCRYVTFRNWLRESKEYNRIRIAFEFSAEYHVSMGFKLIRKAIEDPDLTMQQAALLRAELYNHNAVAAFRQPKVFGKKAEEGLSQSTVVIATDDQIGNMIEKFRNIAKENRMIEEGGGEVENEEEWKLEEEEEEENSENLEFDESEEIK